MGRLGDCSKVFSNYPSKLCFVNKKIVFDCYRQGYRRYSFDTVFDKRVKVKLFE